MIAPLAWWPRAYFWCLVGAWGRRLMRRLAPPRDRCPPDTPPPPRFVVLVARSPDPHTATLRRHFASGAVPDGRDRPLRYEEYARIARAVRAEHAP